MFMFTHQGMLLGRLIGNGQLAKHAGVEKLNHQWKIYRRHKTVFQIRELMVCTCLSCVAGTPFTHRWCDGTVFPLQSSNHASTPVATMQHHWKLFQNLENGRYESLWNEKNVSSSYNSHSTKSAQQKDKRQAYHKSYLFILRS